MNFALGGVLMILLHFAPTVSGLAWAIHKNGFHGEKKCTYSRMAPSNNVCVNGTRYVKHSKSTKRAGG